MKTNLIESRSFVIYPEVNLIKTMKKNIGKFEIAVILLEKIGVLHILNTI